jgi:hypothetical protein
MKNEVNPKWSLSSLTDPEIIQGLIETPGQRYKVGFVQLKGDTGGVTKFGISQNNNTKVVVREMGYDVAKKIGFNDYWTRAGCEDMVKANKPKSAVIYFDITFLCGTGGGRKIKTNANIGSLDDAAACEALYKAWQNHLRGLVIANNAKRRFLNGWMNRCDHTYAYAKSI